MSRKSQFIKENLEGVLSDESMNSYFRNERGEHLPQEEYDRRVDVLKNSLERAYDTKAQQYDKKHWNHYLSSALRLGAAAAYTTAPYLFFALPGVGGYGMTGTAIGLSTLADYIDSRTYASQGQIAQGIVKGDWKKIWAEGIGEKALGYLPVGAGLLDVYRGRRKFESAMKKHLAPVLRETVDYAVADFAQKIKVQEKDGRKIIPISEFRDRKYSNLEDAVESREVA